MHLTCFQAIAAKPAPNAGLAAWDLVPSAPIFNLMPPALQACGPFNLGLPIRTGSSVMGPSVYSEVAVSPASLIWDAMVVGYGTLAEMLVLTGSPGLAADVRRHAASRSHLLRANLEVPAGPLPGPIRRASFPFLDMSEKIILSYLTGQTVAQRLAKICWNVPRLFHRSLYGPLLPQLTGGQLDALDPGLSPDYVCLGQLPVPLAGGPPALGLSLVESKGTYSTCDPGKVLADRERINKAFRTQIRNRPAMAS